MLQEGNLQFETLKGLLSYGKVCPYQLQWTEAAFMVVLSQGFINVDVTEWQTICRPESAAEFL